MLISLASLCMYVSTVKIVGLAFDPYLALFIFTSTLITYNLPQLYFGTVTPKTLAFVGISSAIVTYTAVCIFSESIRIPYLTLVYLFTSTAFYYVKVKSINLRKIPFLKIFIISANWAVTTVLLPCQLQGFIVSDKHIYSLTLERFLFIFAITIPFDIRDLSRDKTTDLKTIPSMIGLRNSLILSAFVLVTFLLISYLNYGIGPVFISRVLVVFITLILLKNVDTERHDHFYTGLMDGTMVLQGLLLLILD